MNTMSTTCCIAGGGPAGIMLGFLLARSGVDVIVAEKHIDFLRDFRGDTIHPSTLQVMDELGILDAFLMRPHQKVHKLSMHINNEVRTIADFSALRVSTAYIVMMPQWDFLDFLVEQAKAFDNFKILMQSEVIGLIQKNDNVTGVTVKTPEGELEIHSTLVIGADGRHSAVRQCSKLKITDYGVPIDVLWFKISRNQQDPTDTAISLEPGNMLVMINRQDYWQCAYIIPKDGMHNIKQLGISKLCEKISNVKPFLKDRMSEIADWDKIKLLTVTVDSLNTWYKSGLLCIGDAAHAMSPVGGVGINFAIQDAVATSNILSKPLLAGIVTTKHLAKVQKRRKLPARITQRMQLLLHKKFIYKILSNRQSFKLPIGIQLISSIPWLSKIMGYLIGIGFRAERVIRRQ